ncbi:MAG: hypothetical protein HOH04_15800 [Rhodospirillaceae bacterium]|nr:hypothetical protein [Rhodospirillaceae bacterium]
MSQSDNKVEFIKPPHRIASKVAVGGPGAISEGDLERIDNAIVANLGGAYLEQVTADIENMKRALSRIRPGDGVNSKAVKWLREIIHEVRGMGGTYGFDLVTAIGDQMYRLIHSNDTLGVDHIAALSVHLDTINMVIKEQIKDDGGKRGRELITGLQNVYRKFA